MREVELGMDMASVLRLLDFLEALFNGGSDFNEPLKRCLNRLTDAKWANSDILLVSGRHHLQAAVSSTQLLLGTGITWCVSEAASMHLMWGSEQALRLLTIWLLFLLQTVSCVNLALTSCRSCQGPRRSSGCVYMV